ncbi:MAG: hypothetical protein ACXWJW_02105 [Xanthobacteraceae bacterium]
MPEPSNIEKMLRDIRTRKFNRHPVGPVPTLGELQRGTPWMWIHCEQHRCLHYAPMALAPAVILWGPDSTSNLVRERARCSHCGHKGDAVLKHPSWEGVAAGYAAFPVGRID